MINQTLISARIDNYVLFLADLEKQASGRSRNGILNDGARMLLRLLEAKREYRAHDNPKIRRRIVRGFLRLYFPEAADWI